MKYDEFIIAYEIAHLEGWHTGRNDHKTISDTTGFFSLRIDGKIIAVIACIKYGTQYAHIGLYIVKKEHRGKGHGFTLWKFAVDSIKGRNIGLDANMIQIPRYAYYIFDSFSIFNQELWIIAKIVKLLKQLSI